MSTQKQVLIVQPIHQSGVAVFDERFVVKVAADPSEPTVIHAIEGVEGVIVRTAPFTRRVIEAAHSLKVIARHGVGVDNIDIVAATERGILVLNTPDANAVSVAEHVILAMGALVKRMLPMDAATRAGHGRPGTNTGLWTWRARCWGSPASAGSAPLSPARRKPRSTCG